jgi:hypothetical protein
MSNAAAINDPLRVKNEFLKESLAILVRNHGPEDIIATLATVLDAYAFEYARKTGDYDGACAMRLASDHLDGLEAFVTNYDGGEA